MINKIRFFLYSITAVLFIGCNMQKKDIIGKYSFHGANTIDSLIFEKDIYTHKIYSKNLKLMYKSQDKWSFDKDRITLYGFYNNEDVLIEKYLSNKTAEKFLIIGSFPIYKENKDLIVEVNSDEGIIYIKKNK